MTKEGPTAFRELLGDTTRIRVIEVLTDGFPMTTRDWAEEAGVNVKYVYKYLPLLSKYRLVRAERNPGNPREKLYSLNFDNPAARRLRNAVIDLTSLQLVAEGIVTGKAAESLVAWQRQKSDAARNVRTPLSSSASAPIRAARRARRSR